MRRRTRNYSIMKIAVLVVLFGGLFLQICMLAEISGKTKERAAAEKDIREMSAVRDNLELQLAQYRKTTYIEQRATELGMKWPDNDQLRFITVPMEYAGASSHKAEITGSN